MSQHTRSVWLISLIIWSVCCFHQNLSAREFACSFHTARDSELQNGSTRIWAAVYFCFELILFSYDCILSLQRPSAGSATARMDQSLGVRCRVDITLLLNSLLMALYTSRQHIGAYIWNKHLTVMQHWMLHWLARCQQTSDCNGQKSQRQCAFDLYLYNIWRGSVVDEHVTSVLALQ